MALVFIEVVFINPNCVYIIVVLLLSVYKVYLLVCLVVFSVDCIVLIGSRSFRFHGVPPKNIGRVMHLS